MNSQPRLPRIVTLPIASLLFILAAAALSPVRATGLQAKSDAERYVLEEFQKGESADLMSRFPKDKFPDSARALRGSFVAKLLTSGDDDVKVHPHGILINDAVITGDLDLSSQEIQYGVYLGSCRFKSNVFLFWSHFARGLEIVDCDFDGPTDFRYSTVDLYFSATFSRFADGANFQGIRVGGDFSIEGSTFRGSDDISFNEMRVDGAFSARRSTFSLNHSTVSFVGSHFSDTFLDDSIFNKVGFIDFSRSQVSLLSVADIQFQDRVGVIGHKQMTFKLVTPASAEKLQLLLKPYDPEFYAALETSFRTQGYAGEADKIFIAGKREERREKCPSVLRDCQRSAWALSLFEDLLAGYGKSLKNLLYWSVGFLFIGTFVFRSEKGMRTKNPNDAENYEGKYNAFWYSLDLFLPIIKLGEADVWTPKHYRRWANFYRKVHVIIGSLFVPIGLAALTGIIK